MSAVRKVKPVIDRDPSIDSESTISGGYDPFKQSNLFHEVYLNVEVPHKFKNLWEPKDPKEFDNFCNSFRNLCSQYDFKDFDSWSETDTIQNWIIPVLEMLGYYDKCEGKSHPFSLDTSFTYEKKALRPDFIIVDRPSDLKHIKDSGNNAEQKLCEAREYVKLTIEAKYWDRLEEYKQNKAENKKRADNKKVGAVESKNPVEQTLDYMKMLHNDWGILTDGKVWRLYHRELSVDSQNRCFQFNLGYLAKFAESSLSLNSEEQKLFNENAKYFYYLFNKDALFGREGKGKLVDHLIEYSKEYVHKIEDDLRVRFVQAMTLFCNGIHESMGKPKGKEDLVLIRNVAESHLFNIMFIKSCESRLILPMKSDYLGRSLTRMVQCLKKFKPERGCDDHNLEVLQKSFGNLGDDNAFNFQWAGTELYERLLDLTEFVQNGTNPKFKNFKIEGFTETVFSKEEWSVAKKYSISNKNMVFALFEIGYAKPDKNINKYQQIPYNFFTARQLGSIYESFLEFKLDKAAEDLAFIKNQWVPANLKSEKIKRMDVPKVEQNELYFTPNNEERKMTGSYYTPNFVVQYIVKETLQPLLENKKSSDILKIKICDPAMGSAHFLSAGLHFLAQSYMRLLNKEINDDVSVSIAKIKREILHNCIFGVDINPSAVKLAKMSLWLESADAGESLENLEDQIFAGDSLEVNHRRGVQPFNWKDKVLKPMKISGFTALLMNPPYQNHKLISNETRGVLNQKYPKIFKVKADISNYFLALSRDLLLTGGRLGVITSRYFIDGTQSADLRSLLHSSFELSHVVNFENYQVFDANTLTICIVGSRSDDSHDENTTSVSIFGEDLVGTKLEQWPSSGLHQIEVLQKKIFEDGATAMRATNCSAPNVKTTLLGDLFFTGRGGSTGLDKSFVMDQKVFKENCLEPKYAVDIIKNGDIRSYHYYESELKKMIYTKKGEDLPSTSKVYKHLVKSKNKLEMRAEVKSGKIKWFEYSLYRCREKFDSKCKKIIFPYMATDNRFVVDDRNLYFCSDVGMIVPETSYCSAEALAALLNSAPYNEIHKQVAKLKRGGYYEYISSGLQQYPLPEKILNDDDNRLASLYRKIAEKIDHMKRSLRTKDKFEEIESKLLKYPNYLNGTSKLNNHTANEIINLKLEVDSLAEKILGLAKLKKKTA